MGFSKGEVVNQQFYEKLANVLQIDMDFAINFIGTISTIYFVCLVNFASDLFVARPSSFANCCEHSQSGYLEWNEGISMFMQYYTKHTAK